MQKAFVSKAQDREPLRKKINEFVFTKKNVLSSAFQKNITLKTQKTKNVGKKSAKSMVVKGLLSFTSKDS